MEAVMFIGLIIWIAVCCWIGLKLVQAKRRANERAFEREVEMDVRQSIAYDAAQKKAADKILREAGERR